jgi:glycosyltransferase involved in cell wall biosynthesis
MNVAIVTHNIVKGDGQGRVNYELCLFLISQGVRVDVIADQVAPDLVEKGVRWWPVHPASDRVDLLKVWRFRTQADLLLKRIGHRYDVILACGVVLSCPHTINAAHFVHGTWLRSPFHASKVRPGPRGAYQWLFSALNARWERQTFSRARTVIAVSEMVRQELLTIGVPDDKVQVIVNGVDTEEYCPGDVSRTALGLSPRGVLALFVGDIQSPIKNLDTVLHALVEVPELHLAVAGALRQSPYPALAEQLGLAGRVHFLGFRTDVADLMRAADLFVLPSRRDSCPLVMLEAMASGLPVVTAKTVGTADLLASDGGIVLERPDDVAALECALHRMTHDAALRSTMGQAARAVAEAHSWEAMARQYLALIETSVRSGEPTLMPA